MVGTYPGRTARHPQGAVATGVLLIVLASDGPTTGGVIGLADLPSPDAAAAIASPRRSGISEAVVQTGDHERVASD